MSATDLSRRSFLNRLSYGMSAAWLATYWPEICAAQAHAHQVATAGTSPQFEFFSPAQAVEIEAIAAQIIPTDETPGAREARVIYFIDRALTTFERAQQKLYLAGLRQLQRKLRQHFPQAKKFSALGAAQQINLLKTIEKTPFFEVVRTHTVMGFLANPEHGGNHNLMGWKLIGFEDQFMFQPPFGDYDRAYKGE